MNKIKLANYENYAYWWTKALKKSVVELKTREELTEDEEIFLSIFSEFDSQDWRALYVDLSLDIKSYISQGNVKLFQNTDAGNHNKTNRYLSRIIGVDIPDVSLSSKSSSILIKDGIVIESYEDDYKVLTDMHSENFVLTGDEKYLTTSKNVLV